MGDIDEKDVLEVGLKTLFGPVQDLFNKLTGPAAEEYGMMWADSVKMRRTKRLVKGLVKTKQMIAEAGLDPQVVPDKLLLPIFESMSVEDNENLQDMWAALLASGATHKEIHPGFANALQELTPLEGRLLDGLHKTMEPLKGDRSPFTLDDITIICADALGIGPADVDYTVRNICLDNLERLGLIRKPPSTFDGTPQFVLTSFGRAFIIACSPPKPKENG